MAVLSSAVKKNSKDISHTSILIPRSISMSLNVPQHCQLDKLEDCQSTAPHLCHSQLGASQSWNLYLVQNQYR